MSKNNKTRKQYHNKNILIIKNVNSWTPSTFYDTNTTLLWVNSYKLFKQIYIHHIKPPNNVKYAIYNDVYKAFMYKYKNARKTIKNINH